MKIVNKVIYFFKSTLLLLKIIKPINTLLIQVKCTDQQLDLMEWKMDNMEKQLAEPVNNQEVCVMNLLKSVSEVGNLLKAYYDGSKNTLYLNYF